MLSPNKIQAKVFHYIYHIYTIAVLTDDTAEVCDKIINKRYYKKTFQNQLLQNKLPRKI